MGCSSWAFVLLLMVVNRYGTLTSTPLKELATSSDLNDSPNGPSCPKNGDRKPRDKIRKRIIGGETYDPQWREPNEPHWEHWIASLKIITGMINATHRTGNRCGGALITKKHVLTAAHCLTNLQTPDVLDPVNVRVYFDVDNAKVHRGLRLAARKFFYVNMQNGDGKVEYYANKKTVKDDIAVIELEREIEDKDCLRPIKITNKPLERPFRPVGLRDRYWVAGWGTYEFAPGGRKINPVELQYINRQPHIPCPPRRAIDLDKNICFKRTNQLGTCGGDSGSPGVIKLKDEWYLQGIHKGGKKSAGYKTGGCNETHSIGVDINVFKYRMQIEQWIKPYMLEL